MGQDPYEILGVDRNADERTIKKAFQRIALETHPDKFPDDKQKELRFKEANDAYMVLSDPEKKQQYDRFGTMDINQGMPNMDMNDIFSQMFSTSFSFGQGGGGGGIFEQIFGGQQRKRNVAELINVPICISDIYYGKKKNVSFVMSAKCDYCNGTGADDPSYIMRCLGCNGHGHIQTQIGPMIQVSTCHSCGGKGKSIKHNKFCRKCSGKKVTSMQKEFNITLPKGINNNYELKKKKSGNYDEETEEYRDIVLRFVYDVNYPYVLDDAMNVEYTIDITIEELLAGFVKKVTIYDDNYTIQSDKYFNPEKKIKKTGLGCFNPTKQKNADLYFKFVVKFTDNPRLSKYADTIQKIVRSERENISDGDVVININDLLLL